MDVKLSVRGPTNGWAILSSKTSRREVLGSIPGRACWSSRSELSVVFLETCVNMGYDPLERPLHGRHSIHRLRSLVRQSALEPTTNRRYAIATLNCRRGDSSPSLAAQQSESKSPCLWNRLTRTACCHTLFNCRLVEKYHPPTHWDTDRSQRTAVCLTFGIPMGGFAYLFIFFYIYI